MERKFRLLNADEIEVRISQITTGGIMLLLYKDARCDQNILDETVGPMNWQRHHSRDNKNCTVSIYDEKKNQWVEKEDTGTESNTEAEKGLASDSFKRACFNWGIGRELYSAPTMWFPRTKCNIKTRERGGKSIEVCYDEMEVTEIGYNEKGNITYVTVKNVTMNMSHTWGEKPAPEPEAPKEEPKEKKKGPAEEVKVALFEQNKIAVFGLCLRDGVHPTALANALHKDKFEDLSENQLEWCMNEDNWNKAKEAVKKATGGAK